MIEAYKIAANLTITGDAHKKMMLFADAVKRASLSMDKLLPSLTRLNNTMTGFNTRMSVTETRLSSVNAITRSLRTNLDGVASSATRAVSSLNRIRAGGMGGGVGGGGHRGMGGLGGFAAGAGLHIGGPAVMAGMAAAALGAGSFSAYGRFQSQSNQLAGQGFSQSDAARMISFSQGINLKGISQNEMLKAVVDIANATGSTSQAMKYGPMLAKAAFANQTNMGKTFNAGQEAKMIQFAELRGGSDPTKVAAALNLAQQAYSATSGRIQPSELLNMSKMATTAGYKLTDAGLLQLIPTLQELGGFRTGTGFQQLFNRLAGGVGLLRNKKVVAEGERIGLLNNKGVLSKEYGEILQASPVDFWKKVLQPIYQKAGIKSDLDVARENTLLLGTTPARLMDVVRKNLDKSERMMPLHQNAWGIESSYLGALKTNPGSLKALSAAFENFEISLGKFTSPSITAGIELLTKFLTGLTFIISKINNMNDANKDLNSFNALSGYGSSNIDVTSKAQNASRNNGMVIMMDSRVVGKAIVHPMAEALNAGMYNQHGMSGVNQLGTPIPQGLTVFGQQQN